jgi:hypothetical protein
MKFRTIFILFNVVIIVSFLFVFLLPFFLLGIDYSLAFWKGNWYLALFFLVLLGGLNAFFLSNRKIFGLVETENWGALSAHLVDEIFRKGRIKANYIRLLVNAYLLQSEVGGIDRLEEELKAKKPELLASHALLFGVTRLLRNRPAEAEAFFAPYIDSPKIENRGWLRFDYAFSLVLQRRVVDALPFLREGSSSRDAVLALLSAYLLGSLGSSAASSEEERKDAKEVAETTRTRILKRFPGPRLSKEIERAKDEVHVVILAKLIDDAVLWLAESPKAAQEAVPEKAPGAEG